MTSKKYQLDMILDRNKGPVVVPEQRHNKFLKSYLFPRFAQNLKLINSQKNAKRYDKSSIVDKGRIFKKSSLSFASISNAQQ